MPEAGRTRPEPELPDQQRGEAMKLLEGKVGIVTGGAKGLGHGISRRLARDGASLLITGRDDAATEKVEAEIRDGFGTQAIGLSAHVGIKEQIEAIDRKVVGSDTSVAVRVNAGARSLIKHKKKQ